MPNLFVIAGPNGAGKSTSAPELLTGARRVDEFVNADVIAKETNVSDVAAGRMTLHRLTELANARKDVAFETTLSGHLPIAAHPLDATQGLPVPISSSSGCRARIRR